MNKENIQTILGKYDRDLCDESCLDDEYSREFQICIYMLKNNKFPPLPKG